MLIVLPKALRRFVTKVPLRWVIAVPFVLPAIGMGALVGLQQFKQVSPVPFVRPVATFRSVERLPGLDLGVADSRTTVLLCLLTFGGGVALGLLAAHLLMVRFVRRRIKDMSDWARLEAECKQTEAQLRRSEQWLHHYSQLSPGNIYTLVEAADGSFRFEYISSAVEAIHEIPAEQALQDASLVLNSIHPDDRAGYQDRVIESKQSLHPFSHQWRIITPSGRVKWLQGNSQPERREQGATAWHGVVVDISDRKATELGLQQSETLNRAIFNALPDLIIRMHRDGTYLDIKPSKAFPTKLPHFGIGENVRNNLPPEAAEQRLAATARALQTGETQVYEFPLWVEGQHLWQEARIIPLNTDEVLIVIRDLTQRHQIATALQESEARLAMAQRVAQVGNWEWDLESQKIAWSETTFHHWGLDPTQPEPSFAELLQKVHPDDLAMLQQTLETAITTGIPYTLDLRVMHPDGSIRFLESRGEPLLNAQGQVVKLIGTSLDITERKQTEAALQESEFRFRQLAETVREGFFVFETASSQYSYINPACEALTGKPSPAFYEEKDFSRGMSHWWNNIHPDDRDRIEAALQRERQGENFDHEYRFIRPDGEIRWLRSQAFPIYNDAGTIIRIVGTVEDVSDRKQAKIALQESEERFRRAFDDAPIGISLVSPDRHFLKVNASYCDMLGYTEAELLALTFEEITHPADWEVDLEGFRQVLTGETRSFQMEKRYITKHGVIIPVLMSTAPIRDPDGQLLYLVGHIQDIRDRLNVERMKDEFISVVSHELRTPLTSIQGALGILGTGVFDDRPEKARHMLQIAINNSDRLVRLVNDILTLERLESGKVQLVMEPCQVTDLMQQAVDSVQAIADQSNILLSFTPLPVTLWAAPDAIIQTLTNLLSNAIKFSLPGDTVWLKAEEWNQQESSLLHPLTPSPPHPLPPSPPPSLLFTIQDQGRGIPADKLDTIFEQFQQVDVSDSRKKGGTGLGLTICRNIVQQHGGRIWVESTPGKGSTFYVALPLTLKDDHD